MEKSIQVDVCSNKFYFEGEFYSLASIKSITSKSYVSWYDHDIYKKSDKLNLIVEKDVDNFINFYANDVDLYDFVKLQQLANSEDFKHKRFAFFSYNEVKRLLQIPFEGSTSDMCGLFA